MGSIPLFGWTYGTIVTGAELLHSTNKLVNQLLHSTNKPVGLTASAYCNKPTVVAYPIIRLMVCCSFLSTWTRGLDVWSLPCSEVSIVAGEALDNYQIDEI